MRIKPFLLELGYGDNLNHINGVFTRKYHKEGAQNLKNIV